MTRSQQGYIRGVRAPARPRDYTQEPAYATTSGSLCRRAGGCGTCLVGVRSGACLRGGLSARTGATSMRGLGEWVGQTPASARVRRSFAAPLTPSPYTRLSGPKPGFGDLSDLLNRRALAAPVQSSLPGDLVFHSGAGRYASGPPVIAHEGHGGVFPVGSPGIPLHLEGPGPWPGRRPAVVRTTFLDQSSRPPRRPGAGNSCGPPHRLAGDQVGPLVRRAFTGVGTSLVFGTRGFEEPSPGGHQWAAAQQGPPFAFRHTAPDAMLDPVVQGVCEACRVYRASGAECLRPVLGGAFDEQLVRADRPALASHDPVLIFGFSHCISPSRSDGSCPCGHQLHRKYGSFTSDQGGGESGSACVAETLHSSRRGPDRYRRSASRVERTGSSRTEDDLRGGATTGVIGFGRAVIGNPAGPCGGVGDGGFAGLTGQEIQAQMRRVPRARVRRVRVRLDGHCSAPRAPTPGAGLVYDISTPGRPHHRLGACDQGHANRLEVPLHRAASRGGAGTTDTRTPRHCADVTRSCPLAKSTVSRGESTRRRPVPSVRRSACLYGSRCSAWTRLHWHMRSSN
ncbi:hypothetical protein SSPIM334S_07896 [Streptomyces spiroverticillatus]